MSNDDIGELLRFDSLSAAGEITGRSYKDDPATSALGLALHMDHAAAKAAALQSTSDSWFGISWAAMEALWADLGFTRVLLMEFDAQGISEQCTEQFIVYWHPDGILGYAESYDATHVNRADIFYNVRSASWGDNWDARSSGRIVGDDVWVGNHDVREGLRYKIARLRDSGQFLNPWIESPFLRLLTRVEWRSMEDVGDWREQSAARERLSGARIARLPEIVRAAISPPEESDR
jgi:hypothetical protein